MTFDNLLMTCNFEDSDLRFLLVSYIGYIDSKYLRQQRSYFEYYVNVGVTVNSILFVKMKDTIDIEFVYDVVSPYGYIALETFDRYIKSKRWNVNLKLIPVYQSGCRWWFVEFT